MLCDVVYTRETFISFIVCICIHIYEYIYMCIYINIHIYIKYIYICIYIYIHVWVCVLYDIRRDETHEYVTYIKRGMYVIHKYTYIYI